MNPFDFLGRLRSFSETFGSGVIMVIIILAIITIMISLWRGTGLILFVLFLTYSLGAITSGGLLFASTLVRWLCLVLLGIGFFKGFHLPKASMFFFGFYALLAFLFVAFSPYPTMAFQQGILLIVTVIFVPVAVNSYIKSTENIRQLFKMGIVAGAVWTVANAMFFGEFMQSSEGRFIAEGTAGTGVVAYAGAFFAPMIVWGIIQKRDAFWRIFSMILIFPFAMLLFLSGVRSAIFGMLGIGLFPLFFMRSKPVRAVIQLFGVLFLVAISLTILFVLMPGKSQYLINRIFSTSTTGRIFVWKAVLAYCLSNPFAGLGIGAAGFDGMSKFGLQFHNAYLDVWYNTSLFGLLAVLVFLWIYFIRGLRLVIIAPAEDTANFSRVAFGYVLGIIVMNMFESGLSTAGGISVTMLLIMAVIIDNLKLMVQEESYYECDENWPSTEDQDQDK